MGSAGSVAAASGLVSDAQDWKLREICAIIFAQLPTGSRSAHQCLYRRQEASVSSKHRGTESSMKYNTSQGSIKEEEKHNNGDVSVAVGTWTPARSTAPHPKIEMHVSRPGSPAPSSPSPFPCSPSKHTAQSAKAKKLSMRSFLWLRPELQQGQHGDYASSLYAQLLPVLAVNLGSINVGLALAFPTILVPQLVPLQSRGSNSTQGLMEESAMQQWVGSLFLLGAVLGGLLTSVQGSITGRRMTLLSCATRLARLVCARPTISPSSRILPLDPRRKTSEWSGRCGLHLHHTDLCGGGGPNRT